MCCAGQYFTLPYLANVHPRPGEVRSTEGCATFAMRRRHRGACQCAWKRLTWLGFVVIGIWLHVRSHYCLTSPTVHTALFGRFCMAAQLRGRAAAQRGQATQAPCAHGSVQHRVRQGAHPAARHPRPRWSGRPPAARAGGPAPHASAAAPAALRARARVSPAGGEARQSRRTCTLHSPRRPCARTSHAASQPGNYSQPSRACGRPAAQRGARHLPPHLPGPDPAPGSPLSSASKAQTCLP